MIFVRKIRRGLWWWWRKISLDALYCPTDDDNNNVWNFRPLSTHDYYYCYYRRGGCCGRGSMCFLPWPDDQGNVRWRGEHGFPPRVYFSRMPRRLANVKNRFPGVKINTPPNERAATEQSSPTAAHAEHTTTTWHRIGHDVAVAALERVVGVYWFVG